MKKAVPFIFVAKHFPKSSDRFKKGTFYKSPQTLHNKKGLVYYFFVGSAFSKIERMVKTLELETFKFNFPGENRGVSSIFIQSKKTAQKCSHDARKSVFRLRLR